MQRQRESASEGESSLEGESSSEGGLEEGELIGDRYYRKQVEGGGGRNALFEDSPYFQELKTGAVSAFKETYLQFFNSLVTPSEAAAVFCWATVGGSNSMFHPPHTHKNSRLSLVYYPTFPPSASPLTLMDKRGGMHGTLDVRPNPGDMVVFPSWVQHYVAPCETGEEPRVSWSCNLPGEWEDTADMNLEL
ncbi:hypothetical protein TrRE_jg384 [Triparma retinervis]|uniref:Uncharacterized protein n=1 Tax=Triparma retinervis TaxID=2557542 RepID=A0A9W6ZBY9_9STRA|nr:hypothetical protein TrRE_jg384 [Triparma retinervis]